MNYVVFLLTIFIHLSFLSHVFSYTDPLEKVLRDYLTQEASLVKSFSLAEKFIAIGLEKFAGDDKKTYLQAEWGDKISSLIEDGISSLSCVESLWQKGWSRDPYLWKVYYKERKRVGYPLEIFSFRNVKVIFKENPLSDKVESSYDRWRILLEREVRILEKILDFEKKIILDYKGFEKFYHFLLRFGLFELARERLAAFRERIGEKAVRENKDFFYRLEGDYYFRKELFIRDKMRFLLRNFQAGLLAEDSIDDLLLLYYHKFSFNLPPFYKICKLKKPEKFSLDFWKRMFGLIIKLKRQFFHADERRRDYEKLYYREIKRNSPKDKMRLVFTLRDWFERELELFYFQRANRLRERIVDISPAKQKSAYRFFLLIEILRAKCYVYYDLVKHPVNILLPTKLKELDKKLYEKLMARLSKFKAIDFDTLFTTNFEEEKRMGESYQLDLTCGTCINFHIGEGIFFYKVEHYREAKAKLEKLRVALMPYKEKYKYFYTKVLYYLGLVNMKLKMAKEALANWTLVEKERIRARKK